MAEFPQVSIITPNFNKAEYLEETILSVLTQDYPNLEYIVVDGGSTDGSLEIIKRHADRIDKWVSEKDRGQSDAINKGFAMAGGEVVAWLNSDDLYFPQAVSLAMSRFMADPDLAFLYGDGVLLTASGDFLGYVPQVEPFDRFRLLNQYNYIMQPATFFKKRVLDSLGYLDLGLNFVMDWDLWCRFAQTGHRFLYEPALLAADRQYTGTKTRAGGGERLAEMRSMLAKYKDSLWPHAYLTYGAVHLRESRAQACHLGEKMLRLAGQCGLTALNLPNIIHQMNRPRSLHGIVYGVRGRGGTALRARLMQKKAKVTVPVYRPASRLAVRLRRYEKLAWDKTLKVKIALLGGGVTEIRLTQAEPRREVVLPLPARLAETHLLEASFTFDAAWPKNNTSAWLEKFEMA